MRLGDLRRPVAKATLKRLIKKTGRHADGHSLYFRVLGHDKAYWAFRYRIDRKAREMSLGPYPEVSLAEARDRHGAERTKVRSEQRDPIGEKRAAKQARANVSGKLIFGEVADEHLRAHQDTRKNAGHRRQWFVALTRYCAPIRDTSTPSTPTRCFQSSSRCGPAPPTPDRACVE